MFCALNGATDDPAPAQPAADPRDERALAGVGGRARDEQRTPHALRSPASAGPVRCPHGSPRTYRGHVRFLLRPGWLALIAVVVGFVVACYTLLAPWQFGREAEREAQQRAIDDRRRAPRRCRSPSSSPAGRRSPASVEWRQVTRHGTYLPDAEAVVRLRALDGRPAVEVLTPMRTDDGRIVAVDRGFVAGADGGGGARVRGAAGGRGHVDGRLRADETDPQGRAGRPGPTAPRSSTPPTRGRRPRRPGWTWSPGYLQLPAEQPGVLVAGPGRPRHRPSAPFTNFSYALQWLTFGAIALVALGYFIRLELLQRRPVAAGRAGRPLRRALAGRRRTARRP